MSPSAHRLALGVASEPSLPYVMAHPKNITRAAAAARTVLFLNLSKERCTMSAATFGQLRSPSILL